MYAEIFGSLTPAQRNQVQTVILKSSPTRCVGKKCRGKIGAGPLGTFDFGGHRYVVQKCPRCHRLYDANGEPVTTQDGKLVFAVRNRIVLRDPRGGRSIRTHIIYTEVVHPVK